ncbi:probable disease resistance protein RPP1 [Cryptomeria japonica]|uniref:probable disease resistance protein RPP1 n=1 Tax=Cryptomeria japonica TaxID=3369 RepID=UPI0027DA67D0|nr:probable disease resistance protein RPP1 [Cryptomeria japonica]
MKPLNPIHAKELFCWHAFLQQYPRNEFEGLFKKFLEACSGLPLSLKVLGGQLYGNFRRDHWEAELQKFSKIVPKDIKNRLKISYDALYDEGKEAFLDTACFFIGEKSNTAIEKRIGLRGIVASPFRTELDFEDSLPPEEFGYCSSHTELMVNTNRGIWTLAPSILGLKIIVARGQNLNHVISEVSRGLVWLRWFYIGQRNLQSLSLLKNLRILELYEDWRRKKHHLRELWVAESAAPLQLRELVIYGCRECQGFPKTIGYLKHLKKIVLDSKAFRMMNVVSLPEEFCLLQSLEHLELNQCVELSSLPNRIGNLKNLRHLALGGCNKLGRLPDSFKHLTLLQHLDLRGCGNLTFMSDIMEKMSKLRSVGRVASSHHKSGVLETSLLKRYEEVNRGSNEDQSTEQVARIWHWE